jgi:hypothetical protein
MAFQHLIQTINANFNLQVPMDANAKILHGELAAYINTLINTNFEKLITLLYRIDVSEEKLKIMLHDNANKNAGEIIATLIIERQQQKISLQSSVNKNKIDCDEEEW